MKITIVGFLLSMLLALPFLFTGGKSSKPCFLPIVPLAFFSAWLQLHVIGFAVRKITRRR